MKKTIEAQIMVKCPRPARCHIPYEECKLCAFNTYWAITRYAVECSYDKQECIKCKAAMTQVESNHWICPDCGTELGTSKTRACHIQSNKTCYTGALLRIKCQMITEGHNVSIHPCLMNTMESLGSTLLKS